MLTHKKELREVLTRLRDNKVTVDMATTIIEMIVGANMVESELLAYKEAELKAKKEKADAEERTRLLASRKDFGLAVLARYGSPTLVHPNPPSKLESGHVSEQVKTEQVNSQ